MNKQDHPNQEFYDFVLEEISKLDDSTLINHYKNNRGEDKNRQHLKKIYLNELEKRFV